MNTAEQLLVPGDDEAYLRYQARMDARVAHRSFRAFHQRLIQQLQPEDLKRLAEVSGKLARSK